MASPFARGWLHEFNLMFIFTLPLLRINHTYLYMDLWTNICLYVCTIHLDCRIPGLTPLPGRPGARPNDHLIGQSLRNHKQSQALVAPIWRWRSASATLQHRVQLETQLSRMNRPEMVAMLCPRSYPAFVCCVCVCVCVCIWPFNCKENKVESRGTKRHNGAKVISRDK